MRKWIQLGMLSLAGCAQGPAGQANFGFVSGKLFSKSEAEWVAHLDQQRCEHSVLLVFGWGQSTDHEYIIQRALKEHGTDAITNARLTFTAIPLTCTTAAARASRAT